MNMQGMSSTTASQGSQRCVGSCTAPGLWPTAPPGDFERVALPLRDGNALRDLLIGERVGTVIEIGLAYGSSALAIAEALAGVDGEPRHVVIARSPRFPLTYSLRARRPPHSR